VYSTKNQVLGTLTTDTMGLARLHSFDSSLGTPKVAVVETKNDTSFLHLKAKRDVLSHSHTALPYYSDAAYDAFLYADRKLYRPGETMRLRWIVRTDTNEPAIDVPLLLKIFTPKNQEVLSEATTLSEFGTGHLEFSTEKSFLTGAYRVELRIPGSNSVIGRHTVHLEDFIPNRMRATVHVDDKPWVAKRPSTFRVTAEHLFGGAASNRPVKADIILNRANIRDERWSSYRFTNDSPFTAEARPLGESKTDENGNASFTYTYKEANPATFPLEARIRAQVSELGGRAVTASLNKTLFPSDTALGLKLIKNEGKQSLQVHAAAIAPNMKPADLKAVTVTLERRLWHYSIRRLRGYNEPHWEHSYEAIENKTLILNEGIGQIDIDLPNYGSYRVRVHSPKTPQYASQSFYTYGGPLNFSNATEPDLVTLTTDKESYTLGETVTLVIESPFDGTAFLVFQNRSIQNIRTVKIKDGKGVLRLPLGADDGPNLWVRATVIHEVVDRPKETYPYSSYKSISIPIKNNSRKLQVSFVDLPETMRPERPLNVTIETKNHLGEAVPAEVTLAAVDEGIHSIMGYKNPDPYSWFQRPRRAQLHRAHYYDQVAYSFETPPIGGDQIRKRLANNANVEDNWVKPVALWSGVVQTDENGRATIPFELPDFNGELRLVAVAVNATATGHHAKAMKVAAPYIVKTSQPRIARTGDEFSATLNIFNRTKQACFARIRWSTTEGFITGRGETTLAIDAMKEASIFMDFTATNKVGSDTLKWEIDIVDPNGTVLENITKSALLPVRPSSVFKLHHELIVLKPGEERTLSNTQFFENELSEATLFISTLPTMQLKNPLRYVYSYPYGCVEQTTSRVFPMYMLQKVLASDPSYEYDQDYVQQRIDTAVDRLFSMQTPSGGLAYWPGGNTPRPYSSVYAGHFLTLAYLDPAIAVPESSYKKLLSYLRTVAENPGDKSGYNNLTRAYAYFVLALGGDTDALTQIDRFDHIDMPKSARHYLAWAKAIGGASKADIEAYLNNAPTLPYKVDYYRRSFNSEQRDQSIELMTRMQIDEKDPKIHKMAASLLRQLEGPYHYNTHQTAFISTALGLYMSRYTSDPDKAALQVKTPNETFTLTGATQRTVKHEGAGARFVVTNTGESPIFLNLSIGGIPLEDSAKAESEGIHITRNIQHSGNRYKHGETYSVKLTLRLDEDIEYLVVADLLPSGFEIENTRIDADALIAQQGHQPQNARPDYLEMRDDRLILSFNRLRKGTHHFNYVIRAVTPGKYQQPAAHAEAMYNAALRGSTATSTVEVLRP